MQIHISTAAMVRGEMEYDFDALHRGARHARLAQIRFHEGDATVLEVRLDVLEPAAGEIVNDVHARAAREQSVHEMRSDKRCTAGYENLLTIPDDALHSFRSLLLP